MEVSTAETLFNGSIIWSLLLMDSPMIKLYFNLYFIPQVQQNSNGEIRYKSLFLILITPFGICSCTHFASHLFVITIYWSFSCLISFCQWCVQDFIPRGEKKIPLYRSSLSSLSASDIMNCIEVHASLTSSGSSKLCISPFFMSSLSWLTRWKLQSSCWSSFTDGNCDSQ